MFEEFLLAHRGNISGRSPMANSFDMIAQALDAGFGLETDLRDRMRKLVVAHDPADQDDWELAELLKGAEHSFLPDARTIAFNVKSDGLLPLLRALAPAGITGAFFFDMSFPQWLTYCRAGVPVAQRLSEFERFDEDLALMQGSAPWVWLDAFQSDWWIGEGLIARLPSDARVAIVSPELHGREPRHVWDAFAELTSSRGNVWLCTDHPTQVASGAW